MNRLLSRILALSLFPVWGHSQQSELQLTLPPEIHVVTGVPISVYFDNIVLTQFPDRYRFEVDCDIGVVTDRRWHLVPADQDIGDHSLRVTVRAEDNESVEVGSTVVKVNSDDDSPSERPIRLLVIGDSLTNASTYPNKIAELLSRHDNPKWKMLGTHRPRAAAAGVAHEGYGGWTWAKFVTKYEPDIDGTNKQRSSPFVFLDEEGNPKLDMHRYFVGNCSGELPNYVVIMLGINDCFSAPADDIAGIDARIDAMFAHSDHLLSAIRDAAPQARIGFCLTTPPNARQSAFDANYKDQYSRWGWKRIQHRLVQRQLQYVANKADPQISVVPTQLNLDPVDGYPINNGVHPNADGYKQIAATIYSWLRRPVTDVSWKYSAGQMRPFWVGDVVEQESVLFVEDEGTGEARGSLLFPINEIISVRSSGGDIAYREGTDYQFDPGTRDIVIPAGSRVVTSKPAALRRPANSQKHRLTHRDGNGEILFGAKLEYHQLQTYVTYKVAENDWPIQASTFAPELLPSTLKKLRDRKELTIVLLGDSISTGCNSSAWAEGAPFQPAYQDLLVAHLEAHYKTKVSLINLSVGGKSTPWGITMIDHVTQHEPDLVILAFGMNDSASRSAEEYRENTVAMINLTRKVLPKTEFILIASMLGNRDWIRLNHDVFPKYRDELAGLCRPGIALADMTSVWNEILNRKKDADLTGNGVNHPNDFGHRIYTQVLSSLLVE